MKVLYHNNTLLHLDGTKLHFTLPLLDNTLQDHTIPIRHVTPRNRTIPEQHSTLPNVTQPTHISTTHDSTITKHHNTTLHLDISALYLANTAPLRSIPLPNETIRYFTGTIQHLTSPYLHGTILFRSILYRYPTKQCFTLPLHY